MRREQSTKDDCRHPKEKREVGQGTNEKSMFQLHGLGGWTTVASDLLELDLTSNLNL